MKENNEIKSSAHSKYRCQYHMVFAPKYRRKEVYGKIKRDVGEILRQLCNQKGVEIIEAQACPDHIHMLVSIPSHISIAQFKGYLKGKSSLMIFDSMPPDFDNKYYSILIVIVIDVKMISKSFTNGMVYSRSCCLFYSDKIK